MHNPALPVLLKNTNLLVSPPLFTPGEDSLRLEFIVEKVDCGLIFGPLGLTSVCCTSCNPRVETSGALVDSDH